jgi:cytochrome c-type biogenesis protein
MLADAIALFGAGIASFLAPCVIPLVPAYLGMITGETADRRANAPARARTGATTGDGDPLQLAGSPPAAGSDAAGAGRDGGGDESTDACAGRVEVDDGRGGRGEGVGDGAVDAGRAVVATLLFVAGFAVVFAGLGVAAGLAGSSLQSVQDGLERVGGVLVALFGLALLGILRGPFARERRLFTELPDIGGRLRPVVVGVAFGAAWSPCVGPLLGAALVTAARTGDPVEGAYACGIGVPFVAASLGLASAPGLFDRLRRIGPRLERVAGVFLLVLGVLLATGWYGHLTSYLAEFAPAVAGV